MFEDRTYENMMQEVLDNAPEDIDTRQGSIFYDAVSGIVLKMAKLYTDMDLVFSLSQIDTACGEYLDAKASEYGIVRHSAVPARYYAVFSGAVPAAGERFFYNDLYFALKQNEAEAYYLEAEMPGNIPAVMTGNYAVPVNNIPGLSYCRFGNAMEYGLDEEDDESLRRRVKDKISGTGENGNKQQYKIWCESIDGVGAAKIIPLWNGPNTVKGILINTQGLPCSPEIVSSVQDYIDPGGTGLGEGAAAIGAHFTAVAAGKYTVDLSVELEVYEGTDESDVRSEVKAKIKEYFKKLAVSDGDIIIRISEIRAVLSTVSQIIDYSSLYINGASSNLEVSSEDVPVLGVTEIEFIWQ